VASQALILAGGLGTRLGDITKETPKPILPVAGTPFLKFLLWNLKRNGIHHVTLSTGYLADRVMDTLGDGSDIGMELGTVVAYCREIASPRFRKREPRGLGSSTRESML
jgi:D-glycero-D-manno-heptose 1,7-bisphosphate phosphatase